MKLYKGDIFISKLNNLYLVIDPEIITGHYIKEVWRQGSRETFEDFEINNFKQIIYSVQED